MLPMTFSALDQLFWWTVPFLLVLGAVVIVHELGHFFAARLLGIKVDTFSVGFGPELAGIRDRNGTRWRLALIPLGGYVKFKGDESIASIPSREDLESLTPAERNGNFHTSALWRRTIVVLAGPMANFLLSIAIFSALIANSGIIQRAALITCVEPGTPAAQAGLMAGDKIISVGGTEVRNFDEFSTYVKLNARSAIDIVVDRAGQIVNLRAVPELTENECVGRLGVMGPSDPSQTMVTKVGIPEAIAEATRRTWHIIEGPFQFFSQMFKGNACASSLGGPVKIAEISKSIASQGFINLLPLIAVISASIGLFNLFPIPVLDGGHLVFYAIEAVIGRPLGRQAQEIAFQFGFWLLIALMGFITWHNVTELVRGPVPAKPASLCGR